MAKMMFCSFLAQVIDCYLMFFPLTLNLICIDTTQDFFEKNQLQGGKLRFLSVQNNDFSSGESKNR